VIRLGLLLRLLYVVWLIGFVSLAATATSQLLFGRNAAPVARWLGQLSAALLWPIAVMSAAGRATLREKFWGGAAS
jgi:hypothetical protein